MSPLGTLIVKAAKDNDDYKTHDMAEKKRVGKVKEAGAAQGSEQLSREDTTRCRALAARAIS